MKCINTFKASAWLRPHFALLALAGLAVSGCNEGYGSSAQDASSANLSAQTTMVTTTNPMLSGQASTVTTGTL